MASKCPQTERKSLVYIESICTQLPVWAKGKQIGIGSIRETRDAPSKSGPGQGLAMALTLSDFQIKFM